MEFIQIGLVGRVRHGVVLLGLDAGVGIGAGGAVGLRLRGLLRDQREVRHDGRTVGGGRGGSRERRDRRAHAFQNPHVPVGGAVLASKERLRALGHHGWSTFPKIFGSWLFGAGFGDGRGVRRVDQIAVVVAVRGEERPPVLSARHQPLQRSSASGEVPEDVAAHDEVIDAFLINRPGVAFDQVMRSRSPRASADALSSSSIAGEPSSAVTRALGEGARGEKRKSSGPQPTSRILTSALSSRGAEDVLKTPRQRRCLPGRRR